MNPSHRARFLSILAGAGSILLLTACKDSNGVTDPRVRQGPPATPTAGGRGAFRQVGSDVPGHRRP